MPIRGEIWTLIDKATCRQLKGLLSRVASTLPYSRPSILSLPALTSKTIPVVAIPELRVAPEFPLFFDLPALGEPSGCETRPAFPGGAFRLGDK